MDLFSTTTVSHEAMGAAAKPPRNRVRQTFRVHEPNGETRTVTLIGRDAWALAALVHAGSTGCTPITKPAPRWSHYIWKLRHKYGLNVVTIDEDHGGQFPGQHARYVLQQRIEFIAMSEAADG